MHSSPSDLANACRRGTGFLEKRFSMIIHQTLLAQQSIQNLVLMQPKGYSCYFKGIYAAS